MLGIAEEEKKMFSNGFLHMDTRVFAYPKKIPLLGLSGNWRLLRGLAKSDDRLGWMVRDSISNL